jgi:Ni/Co efflux regulator RcnB
MMNTMMKSSLFRSTRSVALMAAMTLACGASFAEKGGGHGGHGGDHGGHGGYSGGHGGGDKHGYKEHKDKDRHEYQRSEHRPVVQAPYKDSRVAEVRVGSYFHDRQRLVINNYYGEQFRSGHCPPGLAKKNNGCMPPGQAKKYIVGQRLPSNVVYYAIPQTVSVQLGTPPSGYKYVRVATDILLIAVGTSMVVDAIQDLGGL